MDNFGGFLIMVLILAFVMFYVIYMVRRAERQERENKVNYAVEWRELCRRITDAVEHHATGRLVVALSEFQPFGGDIVVKWVSNGDSQKVLGVYFPSEDHPPGRIRLVESRGGTVKMVRSLSPKGFRAFIDHLEKVMGDYKSPLSEGGDKSTKL